jgi:trypsin-like peptidase
VRAIGRPARRSPARAARRPLSRLATPRFAAPRLAVSRIGFVALAAGALAAGLAALTAVALLRTDAPIAPVESPVAPLRVASGNGVATGFAVADGRVVTVAHVLDGPVTLGGGRVRVLRVDHRSDLALLAAAGVGAAPGSGPTASDFASAANGEHSRVIRLRGGAFSSLSVHVRRSIVAHVRARGAERALVRPALELSARVLPGDSGAPVITDAGALAGVIFASSRNRTDTAYAVDATAVRRLLDRR